jgi:hypothetical protein
MICRTRCTCMRYERRSGTLNVWTNLCDVHRGLFADFTTKFVCNLCCYKKFWCGIRIAWQRSATVSNGCKQTMVAISATITNHLTTMTRDCAKVTFLHYIPVRYLSSTRTISQPSYACATARQQSTHRPLPSNHYLHTRGM